MLIGISIICIVPWFQTFKMSPISAVHISSVRSNVSAGFVARVFDGCDIAKVGRVQFKSIFRNGKKVQHLKRAIVNIREWHESEAAYRFIQLLKNLEHGALIYPSRSQYWTVKLYDESKAEKGMEKVWQMIEEEKRKYEEEFGLYTEDKDDISDITGPVLSDEDDWVEDERESSIWFARSAGYLTSAKSNPYSWEATVEKSHEIINILTGKA